MVSKEKSYHSFRDFLEDNNFILWRLSQSDELDVYWKGYIKKHPECEDDFQTAIQKFHTLRLNHIVLPDQLQYEHLRNIKRVIRQRRRTKRILSWSVAASIGILLVSGLYYHLHNRNLRDHQIVISKTDVKRDEIVGEIAPSSEIQLISTNKVVSLGQNAQIALSESGKVSVNEEVKDMELSEELNKLIVPFGKQSTLQLSDGTRVWVNSGTTIEFPARFTSNARNINVTGEIYIEVAKHHYPFYIHTSKFELSVLGTRFNVSAFPENESHSVVLVEGKVEIKSGKHTASLNPDEMLTIQEDGFQKKNVEVYDYISWKDGILIFNRTPISEVLKKVGRYYNVAFDTSNSNLFKSKSCTGKLILSENIEDVISTISELSEIPFQREDKKIIVKSLPMDKD